jgi:hypothetical protein
MAKYETAYRVTCKTNQNERRTKIVWVDESEGPNLEAAAKRIAANSLNASEPRYGYRWKPISCHFHRRERIAAF